MAISVVMPALEMAQDTGKLVGWRKKEGEPVAKGEILLEVETDKAVVEVEALAAGILGGVNAKPGDVIPVGQTIAWLLAPGEKVSPEDYHVPAPRPAPPFGEPRVKMELASSAPMESRTAKMSPKARRLAKEHGIEIATLHGSGPEGEILAADILAAARSARVATSASAATENGSINYEEKLSTIGRLMAERTTQSWTTVPHFFVTREIEATALVHARGELSPEIEKTHKVRLTHTDLLLSLVARALGKHPRVNASWIGSGIRLNPEITIALAMAVDDGVVAAVIREANKLELGEIAARRHDLTERARSNRLRPDDINGGTFTISNLGMHHVDSFTAIIVPPQAAILAVGAITDRVIAVGGHPAVRPVISVTLSADHRVVDGARAAAFMHELAGMLLEPQQTLLQPL